MSFCYYFLLLHLLVHAAIPARSDDVWPLSSDVFDRFDKEDEDGRLKVLKDASINGGALQLTPDTRNNIPFLQHKSGRVLLNRKFRLWDSNATRIASFQTQFLVNIFRDTNVSVVGEGLAFGIFPDLEPPPQGSDGGYLGLTNTTTDGNATNHFLAVELDTFKQPQDPDDNHVGLNVNGVRSLLTNTLGGENIILAPVRATNYSVWVDYEGKEKRITVFIGHESSPKPHLPLITTELDITKYLLRDSYFGFSGSTGEKFQLNCVLKWNLSVEMIPVKGGGLATAEKVGIVVAASLAAIAAGVVVCWWFWKRKLQRRDEMRLGDQLKTLPGMPREFKYKELKKATGNFHEKNMLGKGGFGVVYRGKIDDAFHTGEVAVKMFFKESKTDDFLTELTIINLLRHRHLVRLLGWCHRNAKLLLVYEYMPMGSLDDHLYRAGLDSTLPWSHRYNIAVGVASALNYLHNEYEQKVVHRDLKSSNILLDAQFSPRLGDFGLARTIETDQTSYADGMIGVPGTWGYIAPECFHTGKATPESDIYSFGAVLLELVCGRHPAEGVGEFRLLVDWVWMLHRERRIVEAVDERLLEGGFDEAEAERMLVLGLACSHPEARERPKTETIVQMMTGSLPLPPVPDFRPAFVYPGALENLELQHAVAGIVRSRFSYSTVGTSTLYAPRSTGAWTAEGDDHVV